MDAAVHDNGWAPAFQDLTIITIKMNNDGKAVLLTGTHDMGAKASRTTYIGGNAAILAAGNLRKQLISEGELHYLTWNLLQLE